MLDEMTQFSIDHLVLYVRDPEQSAHFYQGLFGLDREAWMDGKAVNLFHQASPNRHDLALYRKNIGLQRSGEFASRFETPGPTEPPAGLYHVAYRVETLADLERVRDELAARGQLGLIEDHGTFKSVYGHDPDGLLFEVTWIVPAELVTEADRSVSGLKPVDFEAEKRRLQPADRR
ncbi:MAG: VOC family protein [Burkholderiaceae bacterium]